MLASRFAVIASASSPRLRFAPKPAARGIAAFCALTIWLLGILAASPQLHGALHHDAAQADHTCAVTLFHDGVDDVLVLAVVAPAPALQVVGDVSVATAESVSDAQVRLPPGCGPPLR